MESQLLPFSYVHINTDSNMSYTPSKIFTEYELREHQKQYASRIVKTGNLTLSIKGSYGIKNLEINHLSIW